MEVLLEKYSNEIDQSIQFAELASEIQNDLRAMDYFKIAFYHLSKALNIIDKMEEVNPSASNVWTRMREAVHAYNTQIENIYKWNQFIRSPDFDLTNPLHKSRYDEFKKKNRELGVQSHKLATHSMKVREDLLD